MVDGMACRGRALGPIQPQGAGIVALRKALAAFVADQTMMVIAWAQQFKQFLKKNVDPCGIEQILAARHSVMPCAASSTTTER